MNQAPSAATGPLVPGGQPGDDLGSIGERAAQVGEAVVGFGDAPDP